MKLQKTNIIIVSVILKNLHRVNQQQLYYTVVIKKVHSSPAAGVEAQQMTIIELFQTQHVTQTFPHVHVI